MLIVSSSRTLMHRADLPACRSCSPSPQANLLLKKIGPHILLPTLVTVWGIICTLTGLVQNYHGLIALRLFLGLAEGGLVSPQ